MKTSPITIDPEKIKAKIDLHRSEAARLLALLETVETLREFSTSDVPQPKTAKKRKIIGRPSKENPAYAPLKIFVSHESGEFTNKDMQAAVGDKVNRKTLFAAIYQLEKEKILETIVKPIGRRVGSFRKAEVK